MTSPLAYINDACFDPRTRFGFSNFCIGSEHISRMRPTLSDTTRGRSFRLIAHISKLCREMKKRNTAAARTLLLTIALRLDVISTGYLADCRMHLRCD
jgi:hypothetical protein